VPADGMVPETAGSSRSRRQVTGAVGVRDQPWTRSVDAARDRRGARRGRSPDGAPSRGRAAGGRWSIVADIPEHELRQGGFVPLMDTEGRVVAAPRDARWTQDQPARSAARRQHGGGRRP